MLQLFVGCSVLSKISVFVHHLAPNETCGCVWSMWGYGETAPRNFREPNVPVSPMYSCSLYIYVHNIIMIIMIIYIYILLYVVNSIYIYMDQLTELLLFRTQTVYTLTDLSVMFRLKATDKAQSDRSWNEVSWSSCALSSVSEGEMHLRLKC